MKCIVNAIFANNQSPSKNEKSKWTTPYESVLFLKLDTGYDKCSLKKRKVI